MTTTDSDIALLRAIAEDAGWTHWRFPQPDATEATLFVPPGSTWHKHPWNACKVDGPLPGEELDLSMVPNYLDSRDDIMELVLGLSDFRLAKFAEELMEECHWHPIGVVSNYEGQKKALGKLVTATARQLCHAYARTKGISPSTE